MLSELWFLLKVVTHVKLVRPQCSSPCGLQEAVVQAAVEAAGSGDHQTPIMVHKDRIQVTVGTRSLEVSKGGVPQLDHTCIGEEIKTETSFYCYSVTDMRMKVVT